MKISSFEHLIPQWPVDQEEATTEEIMVESWTILRLRLAPPPTKVQSNPSVDFLNKYKDKQLSTLG